MKKKQPSLRTQSDGADAMRAALRDKHRESRRDQYEAVQTAVQALTRQKRRLYRISWFAGPVLFTAICLYIVKIGLIDHISFGVTPFWVLGMLISVPITATILWDTYRQGKPYRQHVEVMNSIVHTTEVAHLGVVVSCLRNFGLSLPYGMAKTMKWTMVDLLKGVKTGNADYLSSNQLRYIAEQLSEHARFLYGSTSSETGYDDTKEGHKSEFDEPMVMAILRAYKHIGGEEALDRVTSLANNLRYSNIPRAVEVSEQATKLIPGLQERASRKAVSEQLLRPVEQVVKDDRLLRPAGNAATDSNEVLLRPAHTTNDD